MLTPASHDSGRHFPNLWQAVRRHWLVFVGLAAIVALALAVDPAKLGRVFTRADLGLLTWMFPCVLTLYAFHGIAWWFALRGLGIDVGPLKAIEVTYISQVFVFLPGGDLWRVPVIRAGRGEEMGAGLLVGSVVFDDLVYFLVLTLAMVPLVPHAPQLSIALALVLAPQLIIFIILLWPRLFEWLVDRVGRIHLLHALIPQVELIGPSFRRLFRPGTLIRVLLADAVAALLAVSLFGLGLAAVHAKGASPQDVMFSYALGQVISGLSVIPAAVGLYEGLMTALMALQGVSPAAAAAAALLYRAFNDVLMAGIGLALIARLERKRRQLAFGLGLKTPPQRS